MKKFILFSFFACLFAVTSNAQATTCVPNEMYRDSSFGVFPPPISVMNPDGGIPVSACQNMPWDFALTIRIPEEVVLQGTSVALFSIEIAETGAVAGLPTGFSYSCNPPDCIFEPSDTIACVNVFGITADPVGEYDLQIATNIKSSFLPTGFPVTLPSPLIAGAEGNYIIEVVGVNNPDCFVSNIDELLAEKFQVRNLPNPFGAFTNIEIRAEQNDELEFKVYDVFGKLIHSRSIEVFTGQNTFEYDGSNLENGVYIYTIGKDGALVSDKMIVNR